MKIWKKTSQEDIKSFVFNALKHNINYTNQNILGIPASNLDEDVFSKDERIIFNAGWLQS